jgi:hypothetical protein
MRCIARSRLGEYYPEFPVKVKSTFLENVTVLSGSLLLLSLTTGCGFTLKAPPPAPQPSSSTAALPGGQLMAAPPVTQQLTGCVNPNTGIATNDWGVGSNPVFVDPWYVTVGGPVYTSNAIF